MKIALKTSFQENGDIIHEASVDAYQDPMKHVMREIISTKEEQTRKALIALGWTPPNGQADLTLSFGERINALRKKKGVSLQTVADAVGSTKSHVWELEQRRTANPSLNLILGFAKYFQVTAASLVEIPDTAIAATNPGTSPCNPSPDDPPSQL